MAKKKSRRGSDIVIIFFQVLAYFVAGWPLRIWYGTKSKFSENPGSVKRGVLVVANHQSLLDPVIVLGQLPFSVYWRLLPIRFPTTENWMDRFFRGNLVKLLGCYSIGRSKQERIQTMFFTSQLLRERYTVMIFPEGSISKAEIQDLQKGIELFSRHAEQVLFVRMTGFTQLERRNSLIAKQLFFSAVQNFQNSSMDTEQLKLCFQERSA